jgi:hypothetical protein
MVVISPSISLRKRANSEDPLVVHEDGVRMQLAGALYERLYAVSLPPAARRDSSQPAMRAPPRALRAC